MAAKVSRFAAGAELPNTIYVDANVVVAQATTTDKHHASPLRFLLEAVKQKRRLKISTLTLDESSHVIIKLLHKKDNVVYNPKDPDHNAKYAAQAKAAAQRLFAVSSTELYTPADPKRVVDRALDALHEQRLAARDSFHLAQVLEGGIEGFATFDGDFDNLALRANEDFTVVKL